MIVKSILDTDLYKFTTSYAYMKLFPHAIGTFEFFDRGQHRVHRRVCTTTKNGNSIFLFLAFNPRRTGLYDNSLSFHSSHVLGMVKWN